MPNKITYWHVFFLLFVYCKSPHESSNKADKITNQNIQAINHNFLGSFSVAVATEETTAGTAFITYLFTIERNGATLKTNTFHEPIRCNGDYKIIENGMSLELYYDGEEDNCKSEFPSYIIKKTHGNFLIKGIGGEGTVNEWVRLNEIK